MREYAYAVGETDPRYLDPAAAREAGFADVVAPPMFAAVYAGPAVFPAIIDPAAWTSLAWSTARRSSPGTSRSWRATRSPPRPSSRSKSERGGLKFFVFKTTSKNQRGELVSEGRWTNIVR